jgi:hypothetical protein
MKILKIGKKIIKNREHNRKNLKIRYYKNRKKVIQKNTEYERKKLKTDMGFYIKKKIKSIDYKSIKR